MSKQQRQQKDVPMTKNDTWYLLIVEQTCCDCVENRVNQRKKIQHESVDANMYYTQITEERKRRKREREEKKVHTKATFVQLCCLWY